MMGVIDVKDWYIKKINEALREIKTTNALKHIYNYAVKALETEKKDEEA